MKKGFIKKILAVSMAALMSVGYSETVLVDVIKIDLDEFLNDLRHHKQNFTYVDLKGEANRAFADEVSNDGTGGWSDQGPTNDMACFNSYGVKSFYGINFNIINPKENDNKSCITMRGINNQYLPTDVTVPVNASAKGIYFLHSAPWAEVKSDISYGAYTIVYADGTEEIIEVRPGDTVMTWWGTYVGEKCTSVWEGYNDSSLVNLSMLPYELQNPDKEIKEIKIHTNGGPTDPYLCVVAMTLTDTEPYLPTPKVENIGNPDVTDWIAFEPDLDPWRKEGTPLDVSDMLEKPSGQHGHAQAIGEYLVFEDGTKIKLWGTNSGAPSTYPDHDEARYNAKMLAVYGFNCLRFNGLDCNTDTVRGLIRPSTMTRKMEYISDENMERLGYYLSELKKNGIYYGFDLNVNNHYRDSDVKYFDGDVDSHILHWFDPEQIKIRDSITEQLLNWENPYTGYTIGNDPSTVFVLICNECTILRKETLCDDNPYYSKELRMLYNEWLRERYPTREALQYAWTEPNSDRNGLLEDENQFDNTVKVYGTIEQKNINSKRYKDNLRFLGHLEETYYRHCIEKIRSYAPKVLIEGSTLCLEWTGAVYTAAKEGDIMSVQSYWYLTAGNGESIAPGTTIGKPVVSSLEPGTDKMGTLGNFIGRRVFGKVYMLTEWDAGPPNPYRSEMPLELAAMTSTQNWNPFWFLWENLQPGLDVGRTGEDYWMNRGHQINYRPDAVAVMPAVTRMIYRQDVKEYEKGFYQSRFFGEDVYERVGSLQRTTSALYAVAGKAYSAMDDVAFDTNYSDNDILKLVKYGEKTGVYCGYTNEIKADYNQSLFHINTDRTQALGGYIGGKHVEFNDVIFDIDTKHGTAYLQSLTNDSITDSDNLLLTYAADSRNDGQKMTDDNSEVIVGGDGPVWTQPIEGKITLKSKDKFKVYTLDWSGHRKAEIPTYTDENGLVYFMTDAADQSLYYEIVRTAKTNSGYVPNKINYIPDGVYDDLFTDLGKYEGYKKQIERICLQDYLKPIQEKEFHPEQSLTRGEACNLLNKIFGFTGEDSNMKFTDVDKKHQYYEAISTASFNYMITGASESDFRPDEAITKQDFLCMIYRGISQTEMMHKDERGKATPDLSKVSAYAREAVAELVKHGYFDEVNDYDLQGPVNRAETAIMAYRILWE